MQQENEAIKPHEFTSQNKVRSLMLFVWTKLLR